MFIAKIHTPETLAAYIVSLPDLKELLTNAVDCNVVGFAGRKQSVAGIIKNCVYEIDASGGALTAPEVVEATWGLVDDMAREWLDERNIEKSSYEASLYRGDEYASERLCRSQLV